MTRRLRHLTIDAYGGHRRELDDVKLVHEVLRALPAALGVAELMPPFLIPYDHGAVPEDCGVSAFMFLDGGHATLHTFSARGCYFLDIVGPAAMNLDAAEALLQERLPCRLIERERVWRGEGARVGREGVQGRDFGPHLFLHLRPYRGPRTMEGLFRLFDGLPAAAGMTPIMRPYVLSRRDGLSAMTMIAESHISLHVYANGEAFFDLFSCKFFEPASMLARLRGWLGGGVVEEILVPRGRSWLALDRAAACERVAPEQGASTAA